MRLGDGEMGVGAGVPGTEPLAIPDRFILTVKKCLWYACYYLEHFFILAILKTLG
jgi:hypothetical protein